MINMFVMFEKEIFLLIENRYSRVCIKSWPSLEDKYVKVCVEKGTLLEKIKKIETVVDKIRYPGAARSHEFYLNNLLSMFDPETGNIKEIQEL
jgi:hypothetical protein